MNRPPYTEKHLTAQQRQRYTQLLRSVSQARDGLHFAQLAVRRFEQEYPPPIPNSCWTCASRLGGPECRACFAASNYSPKQETA